MQLSGRIEMVRASGFTLVELAVAMAIIGLLLATAMYTLSAQMEQRAREETARRLEQSREALIGFAIANGRLPCPADGSTTGVEAQAPSGVPGDCAHPYDGFLPAITLGVQPVDDRGYAVDAWNNRIRYAVAGATTSAGLQNCITTSQVPHFTSKANLKANGMSCLPVPADILICKSSIPGPVVGNCQTDNSVTNQGTIVAVVFSTGKNYATAPTATAALAAAPSRPDEAANLDGDSVFISHTPTPEGTAGALGGAFDDMVVWIPVGTFYGRLAAAGVLP